MVSLLLLFFLACSGGPNPKVVVSGPYRDRVEAVMPLVKRSAARHDVPADLVLGVIQVESGFSVEARSHVGAGGLMQLMPKTAASLARRLGVVGHDVHDPVFNVDAGTYYLGYLLNKFNKNVTLALAAYNAGPARVARWRKNGTPLPSYSRRYVAAVQRARQRFAAWENSADPAPAATAKPTEPEPDRAGLRDLIKKQSALYGDRPDEELPAE